LVLANITALCKGRNISVSKLEQSTGLSNGVIRKWGVSSPTVDNLKRVADFFGVTVDDLLSDAPKPTTPADP